MKYPFMPVVVAPGLFLCYGKEEHEAFANPCLAVAAEALPQLVKESFESVILLPL